MNDAKLDRGVVDHGEITDEAAEQEKLQIKIKGARTARRGIGQNNRNKRAAVKRTQQHREGHNWAAEKKQSRNTQESKKRPQKGPQAARGSTAAKRWGRPGRTLIAKLGSG